MLIAGVCEKVITPDFPTFLSGYPEPLDRYHDQVHDDIKAHCFYLKNRGVQLAIVTLDLLYHAKARVAQLRQTIEEELGIPAANIMVSATHTHSGPAPTSLPFGTRDNRVEMYPYYLDWVNQQIVAGVREAMLGAFAATIGIGKGHCGKEQNVGGNRRHKDGPADPEVWTLVIRDDLDQVRGILINYALHPTFLHAHSRAITADYPGFIYEYLQKEYPGVVSGFQIGAAGDQSSRHFRNDQSFAEARRVGYAIAATASQLVDELDYENDPTLLVKKTDLMPDLKPVPTLEEATAGQKAAVQDLEQARLDNEPYAYQRTLEVTLIGANRRLKLAQAGPDAYASYAPIFPFEIMLIGIGEARIVTVPCEIFVEFALRLKKESPRAKTIFGSVSNGASGGYVYTKEAMAEGGYEPLVSIYAPEAGDKIIKAALDLLQQAEKG